MEKKFRLAWENYALATGINSKQEKVQVAILLTVIGEEARGVFSTFTWDGDGDNEKITPVLTKFAEYCEPWKNIPFERYRFNKRGQEDGETYVHYKTALRKLTEGCDFGSITPEEIVRDRIIFGIRDDKIRERLLRESKLTLEKTDEICRASESTKMQMKEVGQGDTVSAVNWENKQERGRRSRYTKHDQETTKMKACGNRGWIHEPDNCNARGKKCNICGKFNHFAAVCRSTKKRGSRPNVKAVHKDSDSDDDTEVYVISNVAALTLDDLQLVTLKVESGNYVRFQPDTGAQCNVLPVHLYKKATKDHSLKMVTQAKSSISVYGGSQLPVIGQVMLKVWRDNIKCILTCKLVDSDDIRPIL